MVVVPSGIEKKMSKLKIQSADIQKKKLKIKLQSADDVIITVDQDVAFQSVIIKDMFENLGLDDMEDPNLEEALPVGQVDGKTLRKIMQWCTINRGKTYKRKGPEECPRIWMTKQEEKYLDIPNDELLALLLGANYLDIQGIIDIVTQKVANMANGRTLEQMREVYGIEKDLTEEEEEDIRVKFEWLEL